MFQIVYHNLVAGDEIFVLKLLNCGVENSPRFNRSLYQNTLREFLTLLVIKPIIQKDEKGKPYLPEHPFLKISISHRGPYLAVAFSEQEIGVDIEYLNVNLVKGKAYFMNEEEQDTSFSEEEHLMIWCAKEALYKKKGGGQIKPERDFTVKKEGNRLLINFEEQSWQINLDWVGDYCLVWI